MAQLFPVTQFFDNSGNVLQGGKVYTYVANTTTPKDSYTTQVGNVAAANPIILDAYGRVSGGIWLDGAYNIVVKDTTAATTYHTLVNVKAYTNYDFTGLTATISELNTASSLAGTPGTVVASKNVVVDASKDISSFGSLTAANLIATTSVKTPAIKDANGVTAITLASTASQVNAITVTPAVTGSSPTISASGSDSNINLTLSPKGTGKVKISGLSMPTADGSVGSVLTTNGSGVLSFSSPTSVTNFASTSYSTLQTITTVLPLDNTIPQITEGDQVMTVTMTPASATSTLLIEAIIQAGSNSSSRSVCVALFQDATANALAAGTNVYSPVLRHIMTSGTTSSTTFKIRVGPSVAGSVYVNGDNTGASTYSTVSMCTLTVTEFVT